MKALGDLEKRTDHLDDARQAYAAALLIFRQVNERLGETNCLQGMGQLELRGGDAAAAFSRFRGLLDVYREIQEKMGQQAALGYMAQAAEALGQSDRALLIADASLAVGKAIDDRFGQTINLELMVNLFAKAEDQVEHLAALSLYRELLAGMGERARLERTEPVWRQVAQVLPEAVLSDLQTVAWDLPSNATAAARERFGDGDILNLD